MYEDIRKHILMLIWLLFLPLPSWRFSRHSLRGLL